MTNSQPKMKAPLNAELSQNTSPPPSKSKLDTTDNEPHSTVAAKQEACFVSTSQQAVSIPRRPLPSGPPRACGRRRRHTISNNQIEFVFYHFLRDSIEEEEEDDDDEADGHEDDDDDEEDTNYGRLRKRRQEQSMLDLHHCDVIVLKTDNGWCFDQDIFLPAWKRDAYEAAGHDERFSGQELVKVDEIRLD